MAVREHPSQTRTWRWTAYSGVALLVLLTVHMVAHHFAVQGTGGLRTYDQILDYIATPAILVIECLFIVVITIHAMLGLRSVLLDLGLGERGRARVNRWLIVLGTVTVVYGLFLILTLASRA